MEAAGANTFLSGPGERSSSGRTAPVTAHREASGGERVHWPPKPHGKEFLCRVTRLQDGAGRNGSGTAIRRLPQGRRRFCLWERKQDKKRAKDANGREKE